MKLSDKTAVVNEQWVHIREIVPTRFWRIIICWRDRERWVDLPFDGTLVFCTPKFKVHAPPLLTNIHRKVQTNHVYFFP